METCASHDSSENPAMSLPEQRILPLSGSQNFAASWAQVDLPEPLGPTRAVTFDLCQDFGHGIERNHAAIGIASGLGSGRSKKASLGSVRSKKSAMASAGTL